MEMTEDQSVYTKDRQIEFAQSEQQSENRQKKKKKKADPQGLMRQ